MWNWRPQPLLFEHVKNFLTKEVMPRCAAACLEMPNHVKRNGVLYRAQPGCKRNRLHQIGWNDWVYVRRWDNGFQTPPRRELPKPADAEDKFVYSMQNEMDIFFRDKEGDEHVPVHLICFVQIRELREAFTVKGKQIKRDGIYAVCHACSKNRCQPISGQTNLVRRVQKDHDQLAETMTVEGKRKKGKRKAVVGKLKRVYQLYLIPLDDIASVCLCIPDMWPERIGDRGGDLKWDSEKVVQDPVEHLLIVTPDHWKDLFITKMRMCNKRNAEGKPQSIKKKTKVVDKGKKRGRLDEASSDSDDSEDDRPIVGLKKRKED